MKSLAERVKSGQFLYMTELVASGLKREAQVLEIASKLVMLPAAISGIIASFEAISSTCASRLRPEATSSVT